MRPFLYCFFLAGLVFSLVGCKKTSTTTPVSNPPANTGTGLIDPATLKGSMVFQSNFEPPCAVVPINATTDKITGKDALLGSSNDWDALQGNVLSTMPYFNYNGGDLSKRFARIATDPVNASNKVLHYSINDSWTETGGDTKARVQYEFYGIKGGYKEYYQSVRMFLPDEFSLLRKYPNTIKWLTIVEIWNNITWSQTVPNRYRLTLGIGKLIPTEDDLHFILDAQDCLLNPDGSQVYTTLWSENGAKSAVPIGKWFTLEYYFKEGDAKNGRFYMTIEPDGGKKEMIFDVTNVTHNSKDTAPDGVTHFNPMKMYTSKELIAFLKQQGRSLNIYWDDFKLWKK
jgi:hypothetical protein